MPTERLALRACSPYRVATWERHWREERGRKLPGLCDEIASELEKAASAIAQLVEDGERKAAEERQRIQAEHREWQRQQLERERAQAVKESKEKLLALVDSWSLAARLEGFFEDAKRRVADIQGEEGALLAARLEQARALFGGTDLLEYLRAWKSPEECVDTLASGD